MHDRYDRTRLYALLLTVSSTLAACGDSDAAGSGSEARLIDLPAAQRFEEDPTLHDVRGLAVGPGGDLWVLAGLEPFVRRYDAEGRLALRAGRRGDGPGEFRNPWGLVPTGDASHPVAVWDVGTRRVTRLDQEGEPGPDRPLALSRSGTVRGDIQSITYGEAYKVRPYGEGYLVQDEPAGVSHAADYLMSDLLVVDSAGAVRDTLVRFSRTMRDFARELRAARMLVPIPLWTTCPDGEAVVLDPFRHRLTWYGPGGDSLRAAALPADGRPITNDDVRRYLRRVLEQEARDVDIPPEVLENRLEEIVSQARDAFGTEAPPAVDLLCDADGRLWIERFSTADHPLGYGRTWLVLDDGTRVRRVRFPAGFRPRVIGPDRGVGVLTDSLDVQHVASVPLSLR